MDVLDETPAHPPVKIEKVPKNHYVNNKEFYRLIIEHQDDKKINPDSTLHMEEIGKCVLAIATNISYNHKLMKYRNYFDSSLIDEFIGDGVINCLKYMHNFNREKSNNPFAYVSQIAYNAFLRGVIKENKRLDVKRKLTERMSINNTGYSVQTHDIYTDFSNTSVEYELSKIDSMG